MWMDDEVAGNETPASEEQSGEFARLLEESPPSAAQGREPVAGEQVTGTIVLIDEMDAFVSYGGRVDLPLALKELQDEKGVLKHQVGDQISAWIKIEGGQPRLTLAHKPRRGRDLRLIEEALASKVPVEGTVRERNKGGFVVFVGGHRAFCPISQIENHYVEDPEPYVGQTLKFRVTEIKEGGRSIVLSRRALLNEEAAAKGAETRRTLGVGDTREGRVTRLMTFGAFVDIGGVEGLVHVSEISHEHVASPAAVLKPGQEVRVKVLDIQNLGQGKQERVSLSIKALAGDPWQEVPARLQIGAELTGVVRRLVDYGAFVEVLPGVQGLVHISELSHTRLRHPREVVQEGGEVTVRVLDVDPARKRISLSLRQTAGAEALPAPPGPETPGEIEPPAPQDAPPGDEGDD